MSVLTFSPFILNIGVYFSLARSHQMQFIDLHTQYEQNKVAINQRIQTVLDHGQYIMGPEVFELEKKLADYVGRKHCVSVSNGTDALILALMALGVEPGDEVITTPFSFFASAEVIVLMRAVPVFVDIDPQTYNIDPTKIEAAITPKTKVIMPVSLYGLCADMDAINAIAKKHNLKVIEDGAQSFGASYKGKKSGGLTDIGCTSFFPSKPLGCYGDAGACFTDNDSYAELMRQIRVHGQSRRYHHVCLGLTARMDTVQAAVLLEKLNIFDQEVKSRSQVAEYYKKYLNGNVRPPYIPQGYNSVYGQYTVEVEDRDLIQEKLSEEGIPTAIHYPCPLFEQPALKDKFRCSGDMSAVTSAAKRVISLPMHPYLNEEQVKKIANALTVYCLEGV